MHPGRSTSSTRSAGRGGGRAARRARPAPTDEQAERCLALAAIRAADTSLRRAGPRAGRRATTLLDEGLAELAAVVEGCAAPSATGSPSRPTCGSPAASTTTPAPSSRSSMTGYERLGSVCSRRPVRRARRATAGRPYPGVGHLASASPGRWCPLLGRRRCSRASRDGAEPACSSPWSTRSPGPPATRSPTALRARGIATEVAPARAEVRQADPVRRAPRHPVRLVPRRRRPAEVKDIRTGDQVPPTPATWTPPGRRTCARRVGPLRRTDRGAAPVIRTHDAGTPARRARRPDRHAGRLGGPPPRPRRRRLPRPARRPAASSRSSSATRTSPTRCAASSACKVTGEVAPAPRGQREPRAADRRRSRSSPPTSRC